MTAEVQERPFPTVTLEELRSIQPDSVIDIEVIDHPLVRPETRGRTIRCVFVHLDLAHEFRGSQDCDLGDVRQLLVVADDPDREKRLSYGFHTWLISRINRVE